MYWLHFNFKSGFKLLRITRLDDKFSHGWCNNVSLAQLNGWKVTPTGFLLFALGSGVIPRSSTVEQRWNNVSLARRNGWKVDKYQFVHILYMHDEVEWFWLPAQWTSVWTTSLLLGSMDAKLHEQVFTSIRTGATLTIRTLDQRWHNVSLARLNRWKVTITIFHSLHTKLELFWLPAQGGPEMEQRLSCSAQWMQSEKNRFLHSTHWIWVSLAANTVDQRWNNVSLARVNGWKVTRTDFSSCKHRGKRYNT
jgi:hypothetical protein